MSDDSRYEDARDPNPLAEAAATLRRMASHIDAGDVTAVVAIAVIGGQRLYYRGYLDGFALAEIVLGTMDVVDELRDMARGQPLPMPSVLSPVQESDVPPAPMRAPPLDLGDAQVKLRELLHEWNDRAGDGTWEQRIVAHLGACALRAERDGIVIDGADPGPKADDKGGTSG